MKKKIILLISFLSILSVFLFYAIKQNVKINFSSIGSIGLVALPSPPNQKILTGQTDIKQLETLLNGIKKKYQLRFSNPKGWVIMIKVQGNFILISEGYMIIYGDYYSISSQDEMKVIDFYTSLDIKEERYP